jgi:hypothetical protein
MRRLLLVLLMLLATPAHAGVSNPLDTQQQVSAAPPVVGAPGTKACTQRLLVHDYANSYYKPGLATYRPACKGPWSKVVLSLTGSVSNTQFDRNVSVFLGHTLLLRGSTSEPCCTGRNGITWTVQRDISDMSALLTKTQPVAVELDNVFNETYDGIYHVVLSVTFYGVTAKAPAYAAPSVLASINPTKPGDLYSLGEVDQQVGTDVVLPRNLTTLTAQLFADGHGPCEEFWWSEPQQCGRGTPFREVAVYVDHRLAAAAPVYPVVFTGANGPGLWEPIPSPRAWDLKPYVVDLTPFVGTLVDGRDHHLSVGVLDAVYRSGDYWPVSATFLGTTGRGRTTGALTSYPRTVPVHTRGGDALGATYTDDVRHQLVSSGWIRSNGKLITTKVSDLITAAGTSTPGTQRSTWDWQQTSTTTAGGHTTMRSTHSSYGLANLPVVHFAFTDAAQTQTTVDGHAGPTSSYDVTMSTSAVGLALNGVERETWTVQEGASCYRRQLLAVASELVGDVLGCDKPALPDVLI